MATGLRRQESEVELELKLALEEASLEAGVFLSPAISPSAWWLFDDEPALGDLAGWLSITRRRSYQPSPFDKYRKYALDYTGTLEEQTEEAAAEESTFAVIDEIEEDRKPLERSLKERLANATELDVLADDFNWANLLSIHRTEHAESEEDEHSDARDSIGSIEVTVNSGGVVYFALFQNSHGDAEDGNRGEAAAVLKFGSSRLATQSERLGIEIARHLGVATPQARVIHSNTPQWQQIREAVETSKGAAEANGNEIGVQTCEELLEALHLSRCMLIMGFICGKPLAESPQAFTPEKVALKTAMALGRTLVLDMVLRNEDRLVCHELGWRGNTGNLLVTEKVPYGSDKLGPPKAETKTTTTLGKPKFHKQNRSQSFTRLSSQPSNDLQSHLPKAHPSASASQLESTKSLSLQSLLVTEEHEDTTVTEGVRANEAGGTGGKVDESSWLLVAIDSGVSRRPPKMKVEHDRRVYPKTVELLLHDEEAAASMLREISFGYLGPPFENELTSEFPVSSDQPENVNHTKVTKAFQRGVMAGIRDMDILRLFMVKLYRTLDHLLRDFMVYMSKQGHAPREDAKKQGSPTLNPQGVKTPSQQEKPKIQPDVVTPSECDQLSGKDPLVGDDPLEVELSTRLKVKDTLLNVSGSLETNDTPSRENSSKHSPKLSSMKVSPRSFGKSPGTSPRLAAPNKVSPSRENWHEKGSPGRLTVKLKDVSKTAKIDCEVSQKLEWWDEKLRKEGQKLCHEHKFTSGFLEGGGTHSLVDSYELKVRLEHILERMKLISNGSDTERPSCVLPHLYIGGALAARSVHTLQRLGITHILCLCPSELDATNIGEFPDIFTYQHFTVKDVEKENISMYFEDACLFVDNAEAEGHKVLIHCFEGKSRSATVVLAYLMLRKEYTLANAWSTIKAAHRRAQPNDGFMKTLIEMDLRLHGKASMIFLQRRPIVQNCPICGKSGGLSNSSFQQHFRRMHPGIPFPPSLLPGA